MGILRRTKAKNKTLPKLLETALILQSGIIYQGEYNILEDVFKNHKSLYENHRQDCCYKGPLDVAPTVLARYGTGGDNTPYVKSYCIAANIINRQHHNGSNGIGINKDLSYTLTKNDIHAVLKSKEPYQRKVGTLLSRDYKGADNQYVTQYKCIVDVFCKNSVDEFKCIRRLLPLECERLQGYPDYWTNVNNATDSPRYKALGNSIAVPCAEFIFKRLVQTREGFY